MSLLKCRRALPCAIGAAIPTWLIVAASIAATPDRMIEQGRRIYREGVLPSGALLRARVEGGAVLTGSQAACQNCHRRSGLGTSEGGRVVPAIAGETLFRPRLPGKPIAAAATASAPGARPAYVAATLATALRDGVDPAGRALGELMPRYELDATALDALGRYLRTLPARSPAGVTAPEMHLATIVTPNVPRRERDAMLDVLMAAIEDHNAAIRNDAKRGARPVMGHSRAYGAFRKWRLHVWELTGPADGWTGQLEAAMGARPVFAVVSGVGRGDWKPIHDFCERREVPCLFPNTDRPPAEPGFYSLYLSRGIALEADLVTDEIARAAIPGGQTVVQVFRDDDDGRARSRALQQSLARVSGVRLIDRPLAAGVPPPTLSSVASSVGTKSNLVLWLNAGDVVGLGSAPRDGSAIYLSSAMLGGPEQVPNGLRHVARLIHPYEMPDRWQSRRAYLARWLKGHDLMLTDERVQANAYLAMNLFTRALKHLREPFSRDYLIERIEHAAENSAWQSVYHEIGLGANAQRFAAKGGYVIGWTGKVPSSADGRWVVPMTEMSSGTVPTRVN